ncbi:MAG: hypothetical protein LC674_01185, partial [Actinobacteria bacterium]|nr:hypothetical protein [Actinomycetota bacterium]
VEGLKTGEADQGGDGLIDVDELYDYVYAKVREKTPHQTPSKSAVAVEGELYVARSKAPLTPKPFPPELEQAIRSPFSPVREGAVKTLAQVLAGGHAGLALSAKIALERLTADDSRRVAQAAATALSNSRSELVPSATAAQTPNSATGNVETPRVEEADTDDDPSFPDAGVVASRQELGGDIAPKVATGSPSTNDPVAVSPSVPDAADTARQDVDDRAPGAEIDNQNLVSRRAEASSTTTTEPQERSGSPSAVLRKARTARAVALVIGSIVAIIALVFVLLAGNKSGPSGVTASPVRSSTNLPSSSTSPSSQAQKILKALPAPLQSKCVITTPRASEGEVAAVSCLAGNLDLSQFNTESRLSAKYKDLVDSNWGGLGTPGDCSQAPPQNQYQEFSIGSHHGVLGCRRVPAQPNSGQLYWKDLSVQVFGFLDFNSSNWAQDYELWQQLVNISPE